MSESNFVTDDFDEILGDFLDEASQLIVRLNEDLLTLDQLVRGALETPADDDLMNRMFRSAHSIKGLSAMLGLTHINGLTHNIEHVFDAARRDDLQLDARSLETVFRAVDRLSEMLERLKQTGADDLAAEEVLDAIQEILKQHPAGANAPQQPLPSEVQPAAAGNDPSPSGEVAQPPHTAAPVENDPTALLDSLTVQRIQKKCVLEDVFTAGRVRWEQGLPLAGMKARLAHEKLSQLGDVIHCDPPFEQLGDLDHLEIFTFALPGRWGEDAVRACLCISGIVALDIAYFQRTDAPDVAGDASPTDAVPKTSVSAEPVPLSAPPEPEALAAKDATPASKPVETLRVDRERLDQLMNLSGQLTIHRACLAQIADSLKASVPSKQSLHVAAGLHQSIHALRSRVETGHHDAAVPWQEPLRRLQQDVEALERDLHRAASLRADVARLYDAVHQLGRVAVNLQKTVMDTRMAPVGPLFARFKRVVRDMTQNSEKDVALEISGEKTELDKRMIDELGDPLIHMVRNSIDHGIEPREERLRAGKPPQGRLRLDARHQGNSIVIVVRDDGRGLNAEKLRRKAIERGIITASEAEHLSDQQAFELIWRPGFSTAESITSTSGRGMGMDIVRAKIEELHGVIEIESEPGAGTTLALHLPLTLAILPALMAEIEGEVFAFPVESVVEIVACNAEDIQSIYGAPAAQIRGRTVPVVRLGELFDETRVAQPPEERLTLVVLGADGREIGVPVTNLVGEQDVVIKSLADNYRHIRGVSGASILGDGRVSLILDAAALVDIAWGARNG